MSFSVCLLLSLPYFQKKKKFIDIDLVLADQTKSANSLLQTNTHIYIYSVCFCTSTPTKALHMRHTSPDFHDMKFLIFLIFFLICLLEPASCQVCTTTCDHGQPLSPPAAARDVIRRGKSGPRGEKGERGSTGAKGADHGEAVSRNSDVLAEHGAEIAVMSGKIESQNGVIARQEEAIARQEEFNARQEKVIARQDETIRNLSGVVRGQAAVISHLSDVVEEALSLFFTFSFIKLFMHVLLACISSTAMVFSVTLRDGISYN